MEMEGDEAGLSWWLPGPSKHLEFLQPQSCIVRADTLQSDWRAQRQWLAGQGVSVWHGNHFAFRHGVVFVLKREVSLKRRRWCKTPLPLLKAADTSASHR